MQAKKSNEISIYRFEDIANSTGLWLKYFLKSTENHIDLLRTVHGQSL